MDAQFNSSQGVWETVGVTYSIDAETYSPQVDDFVLYDEDDNIALIFIPIASAGGGGGDDSGGDLPPGVINSAPNAQYSSSGSHEVEDLGDLNLSCFDPPPDDDPVDSVRSVGKRFDWGPILRWVAIRRNDWGGGGSGSGSLPPGTTPQNPRPTPGEAPDCPGVSEMNKARASGQIRAAIGPACTTQHQHRYFSVNFAGGKTGVYRGVGDCRFSINNVEIEAPDC